MTQLEKTRQAAREYIQRGWCPLPIEHKRKEPWEIEKLYGVKWTALRVAENEVDKYFYGKFTNIGILTGKCSNLFVLDLDVNGWPKDKNGVRVAPSPEADPLLWQYEQKYGSCIYNPEDLASCKGSSLHWWQSLIEKHGTPDTTVVRTGSGGQQWYFLHPENSRLKSRNQGIHPAVDWKTNGGQVVAPPSIHPCGNQYTFISEAPITPMPEWLLDVLENSPKWKDEFTKTSVAVDLAHLALNDTSKDEEINDTTTPESEDTWKIETTEVERLKAMQFIPHGRRFKTIQKITGHYAALSYFGEELVDVMRPYLARCEYVKEDDFDEKRLRGICEAIEQAEKEKRARQAKAPGYKFALTDAGNAERFAKYYHDKFRYDYNSGTLYFYDGKRWNAELADGVVKQYIIDNARAIKNEAAKETDSARQKAVKAHGERSENRRKIDDCLALAKGLPPISTKGSEFDTRHDFFNVQNGIINLRTGELLPHDPKYLITQIAPVHYDPLATCPKWEEAVEKYMCGDKEVIAWLQRFLGYCLTGRIGERNFTFFTGGGANGKSTLLDTMLMFMGDYAIVVPKELIKLKQDSLEKQRICVLLKRKRLACINETMKSDKLDTALVKEHTGQTTIYGRDMHKRGETFSPTHKMIVTTQNLPDITENSDGIWDRITVVEFNHRIPKEEWIQDYHVELAEEYSGILNWLIRGAVDYYSKGLQVPDKVRRANNEYRDDSNPLFDFFAAKCDFDYPSYELRKQHYHDETINMGGREVPRNMTNSTELYKGYNWFVDSDEQKMTQKTFCVHLKDYGCKRKRKRDGSYFVGVWLRDRDPNENEVEEAKEQEEEKATETKETEATTTTKEEADMNW